MSNYREHAGEAMMDLSKAWVECADGSSEQQAHIASAQVWALLALAEAVHAASEKFPT